MPLMATLKFDVQDEAPATVDAAIAAAAVMAASPSPGIALARAQLSARAPSVEPVLALLGASALFAAGAILLATAVVMGPPTMQRPANVGALSTTAPIAGLR